MLSLLHGSPDILGTLNILNGGGANNPTLDLRFADRGSLPSIVDFTRSSSGGHWDADLVWQVVGNDVPRFTHNLATGTPLGLMIEDARTWRLLHNRDWTDAVYDTVTNITAAKDATGIDAVTNSASTLTATAGNGVIRQSITLGSAERTSTFYVKRVTGTGDIDITDDGGSNYTTLTGLSSSAWTRHNITRTQANPDVGFRIVTSGDAIEVDFAGVEEGSFATSAVEVAGTAVVRAEDEAIINDLGWVNQSEGTVYAKAYMPYLINTTGVLFQIDDGGGSDRFFLHVDSSEKVRFFSRNSGGDNGESITPNTFSAATSFQAIGAYAQDDTIAGLDGILDATPDTSADIPLADPLTRGVIGRSHGGLGANCVIDRITYWPVRQSGGVLQSLTA